MSSEWPYLHIDGENQPFLEDLYAEYRKDPARVGLSWRSLFSDLDSLTPPQSKRAPLQTVTPQGDLSCKELRIDHLINAYRTYGHFMATINPLARGSSAEEPDVLKLESLGFNPEELAQPFPTHGLLSAPAAPLQEIIHRLRSIYCGDVGIEYMGVQNEALRLWLQEQIESDGFQKELPLEEKKMIFERLNRSELFETFLQMKYTGQKRFSLEGAETLIPMLEALIETGSQLGLEEFIIGMAHRGRLNVLSNILNKSHRDIFSEFEEGYIHSLEGSGDVKYHKGFSSEVTTPKNRRVKILLAPNPSHLEAIDPVVEGQALARQIQLGTQGEPLQNAVLPILIHGDAAIAGQGIVYETLQLYKLPGYATGGTIHIVINNQIGFTATAAETRSTGYCTDVAKAFGAPIFHVNAENPEACVYVMDLAVQARQRFHCDLFIDLNCYRKYGHNESDEPAYTQPIEYQLIRKKAPIREIYRDQLVHQGLVEREMAESLEKEFLDALNKAHQETKEAVAQRPSAPADRQEKPTSFSLMDTRISKEQLQKIGEKISAIPPGFNIHPKLKNLIKERLTMVDQTRKPIDWGMAELLAYGSLLWEGISIRLTGQDVCRGTFSHRHAIWMDQSVEQTYFPLKHLKEGQGRFDVINSPLSEYAALGFEVGYSSAYLSALVLWEAQFGDFSNGAQVAIDQFIASAEQKWNQKMNVVLLLPHGYEGQGPEHSSAREERFLCLAAHDNMRIANPTTPAQFFHLLRRQALDPVKKPLIVFTPKGLLRHPACTSHLADLTEGAFHEFLEDVLVKEQQVSELFLCSGRIYYDLAAECAKRQIKNSAIVRIEQLYPLNIEKLKKIFAKHARVRRYAWVQEEPSNMGAWDYIRPLLNPLLPNGASLEYIGRERSAAPATGSHELHKQESLEIMNKAFGRQKEEVK